MGSGRLVVVSKDRIRIIMTRKVLEIVGFLKVKRKQDIGGV